MPWGPNNVKKSTLLATASRLLALKRTTFCGNEKMNAEMQLKNIKKKIWSVVSVVKRTCQKSKVGSKIDINWSPNCRPKPLWGQLRSQLSNLSCGVSRPAGRQRCWREHKLRPAETATAGSQTQVFFFGHCDNIKDIKGGQKTPVKPPEKKLSNH